MAPRQQILQQHRDHHADLRAERKELHRVLPDLESFNLTVEAVHGLAIPASAIWLPVAYGLLYSAMMLVGAAAVFERRDLR